MVVRESVPLALACLAFGVEMMNAAPAHARRNGIAASDCSGCHGAVGAVVQVTASPSPFEPGDDVTFTVSIRRGDATAAVAGMYVEEPLAGELHELTGEGLVLEAGSGLLHTQPKAAVNGTVTFRFGWRAPAEPGALVLDISAVAGNGDDRQTGDQAGAGRLAAAFGCAGVTHYVDLDRDGHGTDVFETGIGCEGAPLPEGFATVAGDCNDNDAGIHPLAAEKCNRKDDDCDGEVDEDSEPVELWPDADGDGYFASRTGTPLMGCLGITGYAAVGGDCAPDDAAINPGATEVCNGLDDNCEGRADERVRPQCGVGYCRRESGTCDVADCVPGDPRPESCNYLDDDCNGLTDDGAACPDGECVSGQCVAVDGGTAAGTGGASIAGGGSGPNSPAGGGSLGDDPTRPRAGAPPTARGCSVASLRSVASHPQRTVAALALSALVLLCARSRRARFGRRRAGVP